MTAKQNKLAFYALGVWVLIGAPAMFIPTGDGSTWTFIDYFHVMVTMPMSCFLFWKLYKRIKHER